MQSSIIHRTREAQVEIREVREDEREAAYYIGSQAFRQGARDNSMMNRPDQLPRVTFGVWDAAGMQAKVTILAYRVYLGPDVVVPMGGVAGVACLPASRGKGYAGKCLKYSMERMRDAGQVVSTLFPFSFDYYDRFGWAWTGVSRNYEVPSRILQAAPETESVRAATESDRPAIAAAYDEFARRYRGAVERDERLWNQLLNSSDQQYRYTYLYENAGRVEGYLTYMGGKREDTHLREFVALTPASRRALLGLLRRHEMQIEKFTWSAPSDDPLWSTLYHWDLKTRIAPTTMARLIDVPAAIAAWRPRSSARGSLTVQVTDECAPWNHGVWRFEYAEGEARAERATQAPQVELGIRQLSQAYFGTPSVSQIRGAGEMVVHDEAGFSALAALLDGPPMWMNDSF
jgi:predicted acetyltransferase